MSVLPNLTYRFSKMLIKIPANYVVDVDKLILNFLWKGKIPYIANVKLEEEKVDKEVGEITTPTF